MDLKKLFSAIGKQEGTFSTLIYGCFEQGFDSETFPYDFVFPPCIWGFKKNKGYVIFDEDAYFRTTEESYKEFVAGTFTKEQEEKELNETIEQEAVPEAVEECVPYIRHLATLFGKLFGATIYAETLHEPFAKKYYEGDDEETFFSIATLPSFETFTYRKLKSAIAGDAILLRKQSSSYYLAAEETGLVEATLKEYNDPKGVLTEMEAERKENEAKQAAYRKTLTRKTQQLFDYIKLSSAVRDRRKDSMGTLCVLLTETALRILKHLDIDPALAPFCHYADFDNGIPEDYATTLQERARGFAYISYHDPPRREPLESYETGLAVLEGLTTLTGRSAASGKASGLARIILSKEDFHKFREGDILVTSMTRPEFVPLMKKAAAIITDEGGLTCHAAIISRELKKPCIIGAGNATRTLHDGEAITVDADRGRITRRDTT